MKNGASLRQGRTLGLAGLIASALAVLAVALPGIAQANRIPNGTYYCYAGTTYVYEKIKIRSKSDYTLIPSSGQAKKGTYEHGAGARIKWKSGPLKRLAKGGRHIQFGDGSDGVKVIFENATWKCTTV